MEPLPLRTPRLYAPGMSLPPARPRRSVQKQIRPGREQLREELLRRLAKPQRHRLLQGYPMAPLMRPVPSDFAPLASGEISESRPLLIGVLPHTACNPKVRGCGFCTFPHERLENGQVRQMVEQVATEIVRTTARRPELRRRRVGALYFGGGTANLTPPDGFRTLTQTLQSTFDLRDCEVSLEGVPRYFLIHDGALMETLAGMQVRHRRLSMGVQTFDPEWLRRMGRDAFGDVEQIRQVVEAAHARGFTVSADLLFNLPGRSLAQSLDDVRVASDMGFDQLCLYNLVLTAELGTAWAQDEALVQGMPSPEAACETWLGLRQALLDAGFVQTTLTNFERREVAESPRRFEYELASFDPATWDAIGFGPSAISTFSNPEYLWGLKWMNAPTGAEYMQAMKTHAHPAARSFEYFHGDLPLLHLTRNISRMSIDLRVFEELFIQPLESGFADHLAVLEEAGLLHRPAEHLLAPTPRGMFFADAIAGLFSWERVSQLQARLEAGDDLRDPMG